MHPRALSGTVSVSLLFGSVEAAHDAHDPRSAHRSDGHDHGPEREDALTGALMNNIVWLVGAVVIILAILAFFGLR